MITSVATASPPQQAIAEFLATGGYDRHLRTIRRAYAKQAAQMGHTIGRFFPNGTRVSKPQGGFVLWVELPEQINALDLYKQALECGISIAPGQIFSIAGKFSNCIRLNAAFWNLEVEKAIETLGNLATKLIK